MLCSDVGAISNLAFGFKMQLYLDKKKYEIHTRDTQLKCLRQRRFFALTGFPAEVIKRQL